MQVQSAEAIAERALQSMDRYLTQHACKLLIVNSHASVVDCFYGAHAGEVERLELQHGVLIIPVARQDFGLEECELTHVAQ